LSNDAVVVIKPLGKEDLDEADRITRLSFGTFLELPDPACMFGDRNMMKNRWSDTSSALGAYVGERLVGSNIVTRWGSFGWFGPLAVLPEFWDKGIAKRIMTSTMDLFSQWKTTAEGLYTFADSPKHVGLYQKYGFYPRFLTPVMTHESSSTKQEYSTFSSLTSKQREEILHKCRQIAESVYPGLDLTKEIESVYNRKLGDTVLLMNGARLEGFSICHVGAGSEAGSDNCYVKFGAVSSDIPQAKERYSKLVNACLEFASSRGVPNVEAGVNAGSAEAYDELRKLGFKTLFQGVAMQRPNKPGINRPDVFAICDLR
jgi:GNAT superfamily N-acetyltransferase